MPEKKASGSKDIDQFQATTIRLPDGRYEVLLPHKEESPVPGKLCSIAECRFFSNEQFMRKKNTLQAYTEQVQDYLEQRHAERVPAEDLTSLPLNTSTCQCTVLKRLPQQH